MRTLIALVLAASLGFVGIGHTAPLVQCGNTATVDRRDPKSSFQTGCLIGFNTSASTPVTLSMTVDVPYTGELVATISSANGSAPAFSISANYIAGQKIQGDDSGDVTLPAGGWKLHLTAVGIGSFRGVVNPAAAPTGSPSPTSSP